MNNEKTLPMTPEEIRKRTKQLKEDALKLIKTHPDYVVFPEDIKEDNKK